MAVPPKPWDTPVVNPRPWDTRPSRSYVEYTTSHRFEEDLEIVASGAMPERCEDGHLLDSDECWAAEHGLVLLPTQRWRICGRARGHTGPHSWQRPVHK